ncbi:NUDIX domain-containing protein [Epilithonimonas pallida]|uniref:NUDIX domain-containing protein n=1 Tax=Epilithonimonas pallida TaxID=373671 RepID=A0ABY1R035_9FLAO|nr:NUDIX domain-containing protein [Epilithonimonas pallida]SMP91114.1 NUDIX domain-containing protein [Epilithonimonas pallida]
MENLRFCPKCGQEKLLWNNITKWSCSNCDFVLYHNTAAAVAVIIKHKDELFFTVRNQEPGKGKWDLPGGFTDPKESSEETCERELNEELGLIINPDKFTYLGSQPNIYPYKNIDYNTLDMFFLYETEEKFEIKLEESEISEAIWIKASELDLDQIAFESQKRFLKNYIDKL